MLNPEMVWSQTENIHHDPVTGGTGNGSYENLTNMTGGAIVVLEAAGVSTT